MFGVKCIEYTFIVSGQDLASSEFVLQSVLNADDVGGNYCQASRSDI